MKFPILSNTHIVDTPVSPPCHALLLLLRLIYAIRPSVRSFVYPSCDINNTDVLCNMELGALFPPSSSMEITQAYHWSWSYCCLTERQWKGLWFTFLASPFSHPHLHPQPENFHRIGGEKKLSSWCQFVRWFLGDHPDNRSFECPFLKLDIEASKNHQQETVCLSPPIDKSALDVKTRQGKSTGSRDAPVT